MDVRYTINEKFSYISDIILAIKISTFLHMKQEKILKLKQESYFLIG